MKAAFIAAVILLLVAGSAGATGECNSITIDASPAPVVWRTKDVTEVWLDRDAAFVLTGESLRKLKIDTGDPVWTYEFDEPFGPPEFVVLPDRIAIERNDRYVAFLDRGTGEEVARADAGEWIHFLAGPPLLAVTQATNAKVSTLVRISPDGSITGQKTVPPVNDLLLVDDVAIVEFQQGDADPELDTVTAYHVPTLQPLWSEKSFTFNKQVIDGRVYLGDVSWSKGAKAIDPRTGAIDELVPVRDPYAIGGSEEFDLQMVSSKWTGSWSPDFGTCAGLRRNDARSGRTLWQVDLPFRISATLRDDAHLYVAGSRDADHRYLVALDWKTGAVERAWSGLPPVARLRKADDKIVAHDLEGELVAIRIAEP